MRLTRDRRMHKMDAIRRAGISLGKAGPRPARASGFATMYQ